MKRILLLLLLNCFVFFFNSCKKGYNPQLTEENLSIALSPDPGGSVMPALSSSYSFKLVINSKPPAAGVKIDITGRKENDNTVQFSQTSQTSNNTINMVDLSLQNLTPGILYIVKVDVTSLTTPGNKANIAFKISRK